MAKRKGKKNKKKSGKGGGGILTSAAVVAGLGNVLGNMLGQLLADGVEAMSSKRSEGARPDDVAAKLLKVLAERGPQSIPDLLEATHAGLTPVLQALQSTRDFRLVDFVGEGEMVQLTPTGKKAVTVVQKDDIRQQAAKLLEA